jgi:hypothetical protein
MEKLLKNIERNYELRTRKKTKVNSPAKVKEQNAFDMA